jgi:ribonuclease HII
MLVPCRQYPPHRKVLKGDATSAAIAAASVIANEARDKAAHNAANLRRYYLKRMTVLMGKMEALGARG